MLEKREKTDPSLFEHLFVSMKPASQPSFVVASNAGTLTCLPTGQLVFLQGDWWRSASSFGFSCPLLFRAGCSTESFLLPTPILSTPTPIPPKGPSHLQRQDSERNTEDPCIQHLVLEVCSGIQMQLETKECYPDE